jgi:hypothetical protein
MSIEMMAAPYHFPAAAGRGYGFYYLSLRPFRSLIGYFHSMKPDIIICFPSLP